MNKTNTMPAKANPLFIFALAAILLVALAFALPTIPTDVQPDGDSQTTVSAASFRITPADYGFSGKIRMDISDVEIPPGTHLYLVKMNSDSNVTVISELAPSHGFADVNITTYYQGNQVDLATYGLLVVGKNTYLAKRFEVTFDWNQYSSRTQENVATFSLLAATIILLGIFMALVLVIHRLHQHLIIGSLERKYSIFIPVAVLFIIATSLIFLWKNMVYGPVMSLAIFLTSGLVAFVVPFLIFAAVWLAHCREGKPLRMFAYAFLWGSCSAILALMLTTALTQGMPVLGNFVIMLLILSPFIEELLKSLGIFTLARSKQFDDEFTGFLLGLAVGTGFAFIENWYYFSVRTNPFSMDYAVWLWLIGYRSIINTIAHTTFSALVGFAMGFAKWHFPMDMAHAIQRNMLIFYGIAFAILVHSLFNLTAIADSLLNATLFGSYPMVIFNPFLSAILFAMVLVFYWKTAKVNRANIIWHDLISYIQKEPAKMKFPK